ncbi:predicted protein [Naegleria gruberi]|uniref:Predicted protein n=1 Tax=Naegleria gruberi TaxID=5762 RepID=D2W6B2_NAEGR|nr:uncharacterized protein NAEGRDRAFT_76955 [Naegleria gruberi]EFC35389.1 predicted protein [Naegleria gruberi]|eukprot:XP_002668133.1 predicted protein [Naegleria gruberi strain NEG-M]
MPKHNSTRNLKENSHFEQVYFIQSNQHVDRYFCIHCYCELFPELDPSTYCCEDCMSDTLSCPISFEPFSLILLENDSEQMSSKPLGPHFEFHADMREPIPQNFTPQYLVMNNRGHTQLLNLTNREHFIGESDLIWLKTSIRKRDDIRYWKNSDWEEVEYDSDVTWVIYPNNCLDISQSLLRMPPDDSLGRYKRNDPILQSLDEEEGQCVPPMIIEKIVTHYFDEEFGLGTCNFKECKHEEDASHFLVVDEGVMFKDSKLLKSKKMEQMIVKSCEITDSMTLMMFYPVD